MTYAHEIFWLIDDENGMGQKWALLKMMETFEDSETTQKDVHDQMHMLASETIEVPSRYLRRIKSGGRYLPLILKPYLLNFVSLQIRAETMPARGNRR